MLSVTNLSAGYGKLEILHRLSLTIESGAFTAILGPNGSGKSTLLKSIFGLTTHMGGDILLGDRSLVGMPTNRISRLGIAYVPQRENVFADMTVRENLQLAARHHSRGATARVLDEAFDLFPILGERQTQRAGSMSGGQRQMVAIAIGWLSRPQIMLLDEPSAGLAPAVAIDVFRTLQTLAQTGLTLGVVEQNARSVLRWCEHAFVLREGALAFQGTSKQILADPETIKNYLGVGTPAMPAPPP